VLTAPSGVVKRPAPVRERRFRLPELGGRRGPRLHEYPSRIGLCRGWPGHPRYSSPGPACAAVAASLTASPDRDAPVAGFDPGNRAVVHTVPGDGHRIGELLLGDLRLPPKLAQPTAKMMSGCPFSMTPALTGRSWLACWASPRHGRGNPAAKSAWSGGSPQTLHLVAQPRRASAILAGSGCGWPEG